MERDGNGESKRGGITGGRGEARRAVAGKPRSESLRLSPSLFRWQKHLCNNSGHRSKRGPLRLLVGRRRESSQQTIDRPGEESDPLSASFIRSYKGKNPSRSLNRRRLSHLVRAVDLFALISLLRRRHRFPSASLVSSSCLRFTSHFFKSISTSMFFLTRKQATSPQVHQPIPLVFDIEA